MSLVKPKLSALTDAQIRDIHGRALSILENTGIRVDDKHARAVFKKATGARGNGDRITIAREITEWAIDAAPARIEVRRRDGRPGFILDSRRPDQSVFGIGATNLYYQDAIDDTISPFSRTHMALASRLGDALTAYDLISTPGVVQDAEITNPELTGALEMAANTFKPLVLLISEPDAFRACLDMFDRLIGEQYSKYSVIPYVNPITPLILNRDTTAKIDLAVSRGMPVIFSNYGMSGATCPITPGGTLVLLLAELLAGLVYIQLLKEGAPVILGSLPAAFDMKKMQSYYSPKGMLVNLSCAEMMTHYNLPYCGTSGGWIGWGADLLASSMLWLNHLTSVLGNTGLVPFVGNNFESLVFSPATVVYAADIIRMAREFSAGFSLTDTEVGMNELMNLGPGGNYLMSELTFKYYKTPVGESEIWPFLCLEEWQKKGRPDAAQMLRDQTMEILNRHSPPADHDELIAAGERLIRSYSH